MIDGKMKLRKSLPIAPGPFYVDSDCCTACGVPDTLAPDLFGTDDDDGCVVKKQPTNAIEVDRMLLTMISAEFGCIRYAGANPEIRRRLAEQGEPSLCDIPLDEPIAPLNFDHAGVKVANFPCTLDALIADFKMFLFKHRTNYRFRCNSRTSVQCVLGISWYEDQFHSVLIRQSEAPKFDWLVVGLPFLVYDWLTAQPSRFYHAFYTAADWNGARADCRLVPW